MPDKPEPKNMPWMAWVIVTLLGAAIPVTPQILQFVQGQSSGPVKPPLVADQPQTPVMPVTPVKPVAPVAPTLTAQEWFKKGMNLYQTGRCQEAINAFNRVLVSTDATQTRTCTKCTLQHKAECEASLGLFQDAAQSFEAAVEHAQSQEEAAYYQAQAYEMGQR
jgi:tetratricopeptide (TPR) repeat protein